MGDLRKPEHPSRRWWRSAAIMLVLATGCSEIDPPLLPALPTSPGSAHTPGRIVWIDLLTADMNEAEAFYGPLFGWTFQKTADDEYRTITSGTKPIGGLIERDEQDSEGEAIWLMYLSVSDVDRASREAASALGRVLLKPQWAPDRGRVSVITDGEGAPIALLHASKGDPAPAPAQVGEILWVDLWTHDTKAAARFYKRVAGLDVATVQEPDGSTQTLLGRSGVVTGGLVKLPWKDVTANWLPYVRVADVTATARRAAGLGGKVIAQTKEAAILQDPEGGAIGIQSRASKGDAR